MNIPYHISESLETIFWVKKYFRSLMRIVIGDPESFLTLDPGSAITDGKNSDPESGINIPDPQHWENSERPLS